jgi:hypothetical protein
VGATQGRGRGNGEHGVHMFGEECMAARCEDSATPNPSTKNIFDVATTDFPHPRRARIPRSRRGCGSGLRAWEKLLRSRQPIFQLSMSRGMFCTHSCMLTSSVGLEQYQFENQISNDSDYTAKKVCRNTLIRY